MFLATVIMSVGVSTWIIIGEKSIEPNLSALREKQNLTFSGSVVLANEGGSPYDTANNKLHEGDISTIASSGTLTDPNGAVVTGKWVFTSNREETSTVAFTTEDISQLTQVGTGTAYADKYQTVENISVTFIPDEYAYYNELTTTITGQIFPVARIGTTAYGTIEQALKEVTSNSTVYVLPGANPTIRENCTVPSNVSLTLHTNDDDAGYTIGDNNSYRQGTNSTFADTKESTYLKSTVTIAEQKTLTVNGTLNIGGIVGKAVASGMQGQTSGDYAQIILNSKSKIVSNNNIDCLGFIKESSDNNQSEVILNSGLMYAPFVVYDYRGGNHTVTAYKNPDNKVFPFRMFDMPNVRPKIVCYKNATISGYADLYTNAVSALSGMVNIPAQHNLTQIKLFGASNAVINIKDRAEIKYNYDKETYGKSSAGVYNTGSTVDINLFGGGANGYVTLTVSIVGKTASVSTSNVYFPLCWKYQLYLNDGEYTLAYPVKFMSGSSITVNKGASLVANSDAIFYPSSTRTNPGTADPATTDDDVFYDAISSPGYPAKGAARCTVNGEMTIKSSFGGHIETKLKDAVLSIESDVSSEVTSVEGTGSTLGTGELAKLYLNVNSEVGTLTVYDKIFAKANADLSNNGVVTANSSLESKVYISTGNVWALATNYEQHYIRFNANTPVGGTVTSLPADESYWVENGTNPVINAISSADPVCGFYEFGGWYLDAACTVSAIGANVSSYEKTENNKQITDVYAKWEEKQYDLKLIITDLNGEDEEQEYGKIKLSTLSSVTLPIITSESNEYIFDGWYTSHDCVTKVTNGVNISSDDLKQMVDGDFAYAYARYIVPVTITLMNGTTQIGTHTVGQGQTFDPSVLANKPGVKELSKNNDTIDTKQTAYFDGKWYTDSQLTQEFDSSKEIDGDKTLYAGVKNKTKITITLGNNSDKLTLTVNGNTITANTTYYCMPGKQLQLAVTSTGNYNAKLTVDGADKGTGTSLVVGESEHTVTASASSCIAAGTLITLADGTQKAVEDVTADDVLLVFNHFTGEYEPAHILFLERGEWGYYNVINLEFSDGTATKLIYEHALFDLTLNKYVYVTEQNYSEFVGHEFALSAESGYKRVTLIKASLDEEYTAPYSITTVYHFNYFIDGLFSLPGAIDGLFNFFEYADNLQYDEEKMLADIEKYGLYTYEDFAEHFSYEIFEYCIPVKYLKVAVGKGMITYEELIELFNKYASDLIT